MRPLIRKLFLLALSSLRIYPIRADDVLTFGNNNERHNYYPNSGIDPAVVNSTLWGTVFSTALPGGVADKAKLQPLLYTRPPSEQILFITTELNNAYVLSPVDGQILNARSFGTNLDKEGIAGTPVIDGVTGAAYFTTRLSPGSTLLQGIDAVTLVDLPGFPVIFDGVAATNAPSIKYVTSPHKGRPALLLDGGIVYATFAAQFETGSYQGWVFAVNATSGVIKTALSFVGESDFKNGSAGGGSWMSGCGPAATGDGSIVLNTGNGWTVGDLTAPMPGSSPPASLFEATVRLQNGYTPLDFYIPYNQSDMDTEDKDLASAGPVILPSSVFSSPAHPKVMVYDPHVVGGIGVWGCAGVYPNEGGYVYISMAQGPTQVWAKSLVNGELAFEWLANSPDLSSGGSMPPAVTALNNGQAGSAILWSFRNPPLPVTSQFAFVDNTLVTAYAAVPVNGVLPKLWEASIPTRKFGAAAYANGKVYVGTTDGNVVAFGQLAAPTSIATHTILAPDPRQPIFSIDGTNPMPNPLNVYAGDVVVFSVGVHTAVEGTNCVAANPGVFMTTGLGGNPDNMFTYIVPASDAGLTRNFFCDFLDHCASGMVGALQVNATVPPWYVAVTALPKTTTATTTAPSTTTTSSVVRTVAPKVWGPAYALKTVVYEFAISNITTKEDGVIRWTLGVNGAASRLSPIECNKGDTVVVIVTNNLNVPTTLHYHGLFQNGTTTMDGTAGVSQCPIAPGESYTYIFDTTYNEGTYWWHAHIGSQYMDGLRGPMIISNPANPLEATYTNDVTVMLEDWYHQQSVVMAPQYMNIATNPSGIEPVFDSGLVNGNGQYNCSIPIAGNLLCSQNPNYPTVFTVTANSTTRFRVLNMGVFAVFQFSIDGHKLTVVEVDGVEVVPYAVDSLLVNVAQRYSVLVTANQPAAKYWMRATMLTGMPWVLGNSGNGLNPDVRSILVYSGATAVPTSQPTTNPYQAADTDFVPAIARDAPALGANDLDLIFTFSFSSNSWSPTAEPAISIVAGKNQSLPASFDSIEFALGQVVQITIVNGDAMQHPFHLHGHTFFVLAAGKASSISEIPTAFNMINPMQRDTITVSAYGYAVIRFVADNPGIWLFHCHIEWHMLTGFVVTFVESRTDIVSAGYPAASAQACSLYNDYLDTFIQRNCSNKYAGTDIRVTGTFASGLQWSANNQNGLMTFDEFNCRYAITYRGSPADATVPFTGNSIVEYKVTINNGAEWVGCDVGNCTCSGSSEGGGTQCMLQTSASGRTTIYFDPVTGYTWPAPPDPSCYNPYYGYDIRVTGPFSATTAYAPKNTNGVMTYDSVLCRYSITYTSSPADATYPFMAGVASAFKVTMSAPATPATITWFGCDVGNCTCSPQSTNCLFVPSVANTVTFFFDPVTQYVWYDSCYDWYSQTSVQVTGPFSTGSEFNPANTNAVMKFDSSRCRYAFTFNGSPPGATVALQPSTDYDYKVTTKNSDGTYRWWGHFDRGNCTSGVGDNGDDCQLSVNQYTSATVLFDPATNYTWQDSCYNPYAGVDVRVTGPWSSGAPWRANNANGLMTFDASRCRYTLQIYGYNGVAANSMQPYKVTVDNGNGGWFGCNPGNCSCVAGDTTGNCQFATDAIDMAIIYFDPLTQFAWQDPLPILKTGNCTNPYANVDVRITGSFASPGVWAGKPFINELN
ncbi:hypothetical protein HDU84_007702 [Entophlyctis sp. JEL0112]|nr:hypothetical protein HDU84_007702 [Entophlyctis sp. JEL0112]